MINIQSILRTASDLCKNASLTVLFVSNGNPYTVSTLSGQQRISRAIVSSALSWEKRVLRFILTHAALLFLQPALGKWRAYLTCSTERELLVVLFLPWRITFIPLKNLIAKVLTVLGKGINKILHVVDSVLQSIPHKGHNFVQAEQKIYSFSIGSWVWRLRYSEVTIFPCTPLLFLPGIKITGYMAGLWIWRVTGIGTEKRVEKVPFPWKINFFFRYSHFKFSLFPSL
jgi:hypothetical protein